MADSRFANSNQKIPLKIWGRWSSVRFSFPDFAQSSGALLNSCSQCLVLSWPLDPTKNMSHHRRKVPSGVTLTLIFLPFLISIQLTEIWDWAAHLIKSEVTILCGIWTRMEWGRNAYNTLLSVCSQRVWLLCWEAFFITQSISMANKSCDPSWPGPWLR